MKKFLLLVGILALASPIPRLHAAAITVSQINFSRYAQAYNENRFVAGAQGQVGDSFSQASQGTMEVGLSTMGPTPWAPSVNMQWANGVPTPVKLTMDIGTSSEIRISVSVGSGSVSSVLNVPSFNELYFVAPGFW